LFVSLLEVTSKVRMDGEWFVNVYDSVNCWTIVFSCIGAAYNESLGAVVDLLQQQAPGTLAHASQLS
jgi:hypothetical protein